jgi:hypothetical protein
MVHLFFLIPVNQLLLSVLVGAALPQSRIHARDAGAGAGKAGVKEREIFFGKEESMSVCRAVRYEWLGCSSLKENLIM